MLLKYRDKQEIFYFLFSSFVTTENRTKKQQIVRVQIFTEYLPIVLQQSSFQQLLKAYSKMPKIIRT